MDAEAIDMLRVDVIALGGITPTRELVALGRERGLQVSGHVSPETSVHLGVITETFARTGPDADRYDPSARLVRDGPSFAQGQITPNDLPGLGFDLEWAAFGLEDQETES
jgi:L-alanine-DL-glutamate epimerase-like enolase superfamily enzyme